MAESPKPRMRSPIISPVSEDEIRHQILGMLENMPVDSHVLVKKHDRRKEIDGRFYTVTFLDRAKFYHDDPTAPNVSEDESPTELHWYETWRAWILLWIGMVVGAAFACLGVILS